MLELGTLSEFFIIFIAALILIGPQEMPKVLRTLGRWSQKIHSFTFHFRQGVNQYIQESEIEDYRRSTSQYTSQSSPPDLSHEKAESSAVPKNDHGNL